MFSRNRPRSQLSLDIEAFLNMEDEEDSSFRGFLANCSPFGDTTSHSSREQIPPNSEELEEVPLYILRRSENGSAQSIWQSLYLENPCHRRSQDACVGDASPSALLGYDPYRVYCNAIVSGCIFDPDRTSSSKLSSMGTESSRSVQGNLTVPRLTITDKELQEIANYRKEIRAKHMRTVDPQAKREAEAFKEIAGLLSAIDIRVESAHNFPELIALWRHRRPRRYTSIPYNFAFGERKQCEISESTSAQVNHVVGSPPAVRCSDVELREIASHRLERQAAHSRTIDYSTKRQADAFKEVGSLLETIDGRVMSSLDFPELLALSERRKQMRHTSLCELKSRHKLVTHYEKTANGECLAIEDQQETANTQMLPSVRALPIVALEEAKLCGLNSYGELSVEPAKAQALPSISALAAVALEEAKLCGLSSFREVSIGGAVDQCKANRGQHSYVTLSDAELQEIEIYKQEIRARYAKSAEPLIKKQAEEFAGSKCGSNLLVNHYRFPTVNNIYALFEETSLLKTISRQSPTGQEGSVGKPTVEEVGVNSVAPFIHASKTVEATIEDSLEQTLSDDGDIEQGSIELEMNKIETPAQSMAKKAKKGFFSRVSHYLRKRLRLLNCVR